MPENLTLKQGRNVILLFREYAKRDQEDAWVLAFQSEHSIPVSVSTDAVQTKDGTQQIPQEVEYDPSATAYMADGDTRVRELKKAVIDKSLFEFWELDKSEKGTDENEGKFFATYYQGYVTDFEASAPVDGAVEVEMSYAFNGVGQEGYATLTKEQEQVTQYTFQDTVKASNPSESPSE